MLNEKKIKASDVMQTDVVTLSSDTPILQAIDTLEEYSISGAPVVDEAGVLVGVVSTTDIVKAERLRAEVEDDASPPVSAFYRADPLDDEDEEISFSREDYDSNELRRLTVADVMTDHIISVSPDANLSEVASAMVRESIHRVFVVDAEKLVGIISTFDVVRRLADPALVR